MSQEEADMRVDPARAAALISQLQSVNGRIAAAAKGREVSACIVIYLFESY